jgi:hypothetical protein
VAHLTPGRCGLHLARVHLEASPSRVLRTPTPLHVADAAPMIRRPVSAPVKETSSTSGASVSGVRRNGRPGSTQRPPACIRGRASRRVSNGTGDSLHGPRPDGWTSNNMRATGLVARRFPGTPGSTRTFTHLPTSGRVRQAVAKLRA